MILLIENIWEEQLMKKNFSVVLATVMTIYLVTGCVQKVNTILKATKKIKIGVCLSKFSDKFWTYSLNEIKNYSKPLDNVEVLYADAKWDSSLQLSQVENFISQRVDVLLVAPVDSNDSKKITDKANAAKIPIITLNDPFATQDDAACFIGSDANQQGTLEMEYLAKKMNYKGNVAIMLGKIDGELKRLRTEAYHEVIAKYPDMNIVVEQTADWDRTRGMALMQTWLESGKKIDAVACNSDEMAIGASKAIEAAGKLGKIYVGGIDATPDGLDYLKSGKLDVTVFQDGAGQARCAIDTAIKLSRSEHVEKTILFQNELVTPENADKYIARWKN